MSRVFVTALLASCCVLAQDVSQSRVPAALQVPSSLNLLFQAHGVGDQVYSCKRVDEKYAWTLKEPDARLIGKDGRGIGRHFAGPTWESNDGSSVSGKAAASAPSPNDRHSVAWLRLEAVRHEGKGKMSEVLAIQRLNTKGGQPPEDGCDSSHTGAETRVPYEADYYFYGSR